MNTSLNPDSTIETLPGPSSTLQSAGGVDGPASSAAAHQQTSLDQALRRADAYFQAGQLEVARDFMELALATAPRRVDILAALGSLEYQLGRRDQACERFAMAVHLKPEDPSLHLRWALSCRDSGRREEFETHLKAALDLDPTHLASMGVLAQYLLENRCYQQAARIYVTILSRTPNDIVSLLALGKCFYHLQDTATTRLVFEKVLEIEPQNALAIENLALLDQTHGTTTSSPRPVPSRPGPAPSPAKPAATVTGHGESGRTSPRLEDFLQAADEVYQRGDLAGACESLKKASALAPASLPVSESLGSLEFQIGNYEAATQTFLAALQHHPEQATLHLRLAACWRQLDRPDQFEKSLRKALLLDPANPDANLMWANYCWGQSNYFEAARTCVKVLNSRREDVGAIMLLGQCLVRLGDREAAKDSFEEVLRLDPAHASARDCLQALQGNVDLRAVL
jgi:tetratricopeptide (TPR) repeat protein